MFRIFLLAALIVGVAIVAPPSSHALEMQDPCDIKGCEKGGANGIPGPGPGDPSLGGSTMPPGGDHRKFPNDDGDGKRAGKTNGKTKKKEPVRSIGRKGGSGTIHTPRRPICESARDARARNSPAAPGLEAQCRAAGGSP